MPAGIVQRLKRAYSAGGYWSKAVWGCQRHPRGLLPTTASPRTFGHPEENLHTKASRGECRTRGVRYFAHPVTIPRPVTSPSA